MVNPITHSLDIIVPVFNEQDVLSKFHNQLCAVVDHLPVQTRIIYVNDGSVDQSQKALEELSTKDKRILIIELSRNFGHQSALTAGLEKAEADYVITMDGDGQHPPSMIPEMLQLAQQGYDMVLTQRLEENGLTPFKKITSGGFYWLLNRIGDTNVMPGGADFRLLTREVVEAINEMPEYHRFLRGMVSWVGFTSSILPFTPSQRLAGKSKYSLKKMIRLASDAIFSFSLVPLIISISIGLGFLVLALIEAIYVLSFWITGNTQNLAPGWSSLMFMLLLVGGSIMISMGLIGVYIGYIFQEVKQRPKYIIRKSSRKQIIEENK
ncbi:MAG: glycosyltransferase family 2 protein [Anaerolineaceae bacterium]|nr:glycosyltransferase family 2 protein [Anaerolineaceae bacterium]